MANDKDHKKSKATETAGGRGKQRKKNSAVAKQRAAHPVKE